MDTHCVFYSFFTVMFQIAEYDSHKNCRSNEGDHSENHKIPLLNSHSGND